MHSLARVLGISVLFSLLAGCLKVELGGSVPGANVEIADLRTGEVIEGGLTTRTLADYNQAPPQPWDDLSDLARMINIGYLRVDKAQYNDSRWYLVTAQGGGDMDADSNVA